MLPFIPVGEDHLFRFVLTGSAYTLYILEDYVFGMTGSAYTSYILEDHVLWYDRLGIYFPEYTLHVL